MSYLKLFNELLSPADIKINGTRDWDIRLHDETVLDRILIDGSLGLGETYMEGLWDCDRIDELVSRITQHNLEEKLGVKAKLLLGAHFGRQKVVNFFNRQSVERCNKDVPFHYDLGNDLFKVMLDDRMTYTCGYWKESFDLNSAQTAKLDLICRKLDLQPGMHILDIGCGWGSFMNYAAEHYGVICHGLTLSKEQAALGIETARSKKLPVSFILQDYRQYVPAISYDRVVSIGMIEHVGPDNYKDFFTCANRFLKDDGMFLLHTIGSPKSQSETDPWINKYIFPNGVIPSISQLGTAMEDTFNIEDLHNIGPDYDKTLMAWCRNFEDNWDKISHKYNDTFYRMWRYYLLSCAGAFRSRNLSVWQLALTKEGTQLPQFARAV
ncbi:cyclopropane fatty acyl phospholipid synthase [Photobacterium sp. DNB22_13_2]